MQPTQRPACPIAALGSDSRAPLQLANRGRSASASKRRPRWDNRVQAPRSPRRPMGSSSTLMERSLPRRRNSRADQPKPALAGPISEDRLEPIASERTDSAQISFADKQASLFVAAWLPRQLRKAEYQLDSSAATLARVRKSGYFAACSLPAWELPRLPAVILKRNAGRFFPGRNCADNSNRGRGPSLRKFSREITESRRGASPSITSRRLLSCHPMRCMRGSRATRLIWPPKLPNERWPTPLSPAARSTPSSSADRKSVV